ncbi:hypothetical protein HK104_006500 [Borealophlyctis nickersoniae]|nr:hypothetical protein HK104_006500 [Borealophlyctis nickersoniae]
MFFWLFPAQDPTSAHPPLIIWLQGGPGSSSMIGLFNENGPIQIDNATGKLKLNPASWNEKYSMLFVDNPVGTGFSFVEPRVNVTPAADVKEDELDWSLIKSNDRRMLHVRGEEPQEEPRYSDGYVSNQAAAARDFLIFLDRFYELFPEQEGCQLYITGESYAGKYIPSFATAIHQRNTHAASADKKIPLAGIAIGDGLTDPTTQIHAHAPLSVALGLLSPTQATKIANLASLAVAYMQKNDWIHATAIRKLLFSRFANMTGGINWYDVRKGDTPNDWTPMFDFLARTDVKTSLNVGANATFEKKESAVAVFLQEDIMKSTAHLFPPLLEAGYNVLLYQGQFDYRDGILGQNRWIFQMEWSGGDGFAKAERKVWRVGGSIAGYSTEFRNLRRVEVLNAGHNAPMDQPWAVKGMIEEFVGG